jgi:hypothetical protein
MKPSHKGKARDKVIAKWLVAVKEKEINPSVLLKMIREKRPINKMILILLFFSRTENSFNIELNTFCRIK